MKHPHQKYLIVLLLVHLSSFSQISLTTPDNKKVILYPNGFWCFENETKSYYFYLPQILKNDVILHHTAYSVSYDTLHHLPKWTIYEINASLLQNSVAERKNKFEKDPLLPQCTHLNSDYKNSGYDRGHLVPAADMQFSETTMQESFYFSNIAPQLPSFNRGIWKKLEEQIRNWALENKKLIVISGVVIADTLPYFGKQKIYVPYYFYKIVADITSTNGIELIGFILPNAKVEAPVSKYTVPVDSIEHLLHIDFFPALEDSIEEKAEKQINLKHWKL
ncbi:MAG: hypothetical protein KatS3mg027_0441 [Bacteroidia bacterium]|nr:MAG: hypothetical protein KatS3mg027_0441 [Bacteroidia bacterium]